jgi:hypothetical protein
LRAFPRGKEQLWFSREWLPTEQRYQWSSEGERGSRSDAKAEFQRDPKHESFTLPNALYRQNACFRVLATAAQSNFLEATCHSYSPQDLTSGDLETLGNLRQKTAEALSTDALRPQRLQDFRRKSAEISR